MLLPVTELPLRYLDPAQHAFVLGPGASQGASTERMFTVENKMAKAVGGDRMGGIAPDRRI